MSTSFGPLRALVADPPNQPWFNKDGTPTKSTFKYLASISDLANEIQLAQVAFAEISGALAAIAQLEKRVQTLEALVAQIAKPPQDLVQLRRDVDLLIGYTLEA